MSNKLAYANQKIVYDNTLIHVSRRLENIFLEYLPAGSSVKIHFGVPPAKDAVFDGPTISIFLNQVEEDAEMRHGSFGRYDHDNLLYFPGSVNLRCVYYISYWDKAEEEAEDIEPDGQMMTMFNVILNALINNRELTYSIDGSDDYAFRAYTRLLPLQETPLAMTSFWQALGNRPRLVLNYQITFPIFKQPEVIQVPVLSDITTAMDQKATVNIDEEVAAILWQRLYDALIDEVVDSYEKKAQLNNLVVNSSPVASDEIAENRVAIVVSGVVEPSIKNLIEIEIALWVDESDPKNIVTIGTTEFVIHEVKDSVVVVEVS